MFGSQDQLGHNFHLPSHTRRIPSKKSKFLVGSATSELATLPSAEGSTWLDMNWISWAVIEFCVVFNESSVSRRQIRWLMMRSHTCWFRRESKRGIPKSTFSTVQLASFVDLRRSADASRCGVAPFVSSILSNSSSKISAHEESNNNS